jgi:DNA-3-methyladenine glycosylase
MYGPAGLAYVYLVYGMYDCLNVVTGPTGAAAAVLIRAVAPMAGIDLMRADRGAVAQARRRRLRDDPVAAAAARERLERLPAERLASGPGAVGAAFGLSRAWTGTDLCDPASRLRLEPGAEVEPGHVETGPRVGVDYAGPDWSSRPWRFWIRDHPSVSRPGR